jgi:hypothetical protein
MLASWAPPVPFTELPPVPGWPPVAGAPPAAELPPVPGWPPVAGAPPVADLPPVPGWPPVAGAPPVADLPPVPGCPPVAGAPPVAELPPTEDIPPIPPPAPPLLGDGVLFPPQDGRTTARPDTSIPSRIFFIREPPASNRHTIRATAIEPLRPYSSRWGLLRFTQSRVARSIRRDGGPTIVPNRGPPRTKVDHGLDGERHAWFEHGRGLRIVMVGKRRP